MSFFISYPSSALRHEIRPRADLLSMSEECAV